ncbi:MAG: carbon-nitrogen hydrolase family protein [Alphaproteobacteria bacterium]|nr:carbon-nitrogen hydrolase family protein [Alphaproteobacteria bacterium]MBL6776034.1 carbon-nitrogen hydrolase family protein [Alphaproteobacteria bacterium]
MTKAAVLQYTARGTQDETLPIVEALVTGAAKAGAEIICLPECANFLAANKPSLRKHAEDEADSRSLALLTNLARKHHIIVSAGSLMMAADPNNPEDNRAANRSFLITQDGEIAARYDKIHMFDADVGDGKSYRESDHFRPGTNMVDVQTSKAHFGLSICYDVRFAGLYRKLAQQGAEVITIPAAFTRPSGQAHWHVLQRARAIETGCFVLASAQIGAHDDGRETYGHSLIVNPWGEVLADAGTMEEGFVTAVLDLDEVVIARQRIRNLQHAPNYS